MTDQFENYCARLEQVALKVIRRYGQEVSAILEEGMSPPQFFVMRLLSLSGSMTVSELSEVLGVTPSAITYLCDRLASVGFLDRVRDESDRRVVWLRLTEHGRVKLYELESKRMDLLRHFLGNFQLEDMNRLVEILNRLESAIDEAPHYNKP